MAARFRYSEFFSCLPVTRNTKGAILLALAGYRRKDIRRLLSKCNGISRQSQKFIIANADKLIPLMNGPFEKIEESPEGLRISSNDVSLIIEDRDNVIVLFELFFQDIYHVQASIEELLFIDVGMNVGYAAIHFASENKNAIVYAYEPVLSTFSRGERNIASNPILAKRIIAKNVGLGMKDGELNVSHLDANSGSTSVYGASSNGSDQVRIKIVNAANELRDAILQNSSRTIILKSDCEGAEYAIIESLIETRLIDNIDIILMEWHALTPQMSKELLVAHLRESGFIVMLQTDPVAHGSGMVRGMVRAVRPTKSRPFD